LYVDPVVIDSDGPCTRVIAVDSVEILFGYVVNLKSSEYCNLNSRYEKFRKSAASSRYVDAT